VSKGKPLTAQEALDTLGPIPLAATREHAIGDVSPILESKIIPVGTKLAVVSPCILEELISYYEAAGWTVSDGILRANWFYRAVAE